MHHNEFNFDWTTSVNCCARRSTDGHSPRRTLFRSTLHCQGYLKEFPVRYCPSTSRQNEHFTAEDHEVWAVLPFREPPHRQHFRIQMPLPLAPIKCRIHYPASRPCRVARRPLEPRATSATSAALARPGRRVQCSQLALSAQTSLARYIVNLLYTCYNLARRAPSPKPHRQTRARVTRVFGPAT